MATIPPLPDVEPGDAIFRASGRQLTAIINRTPPLAFVLSSLPRAVTGVMPPGWTIAHRDGAVDILDDTGNGLLVRQNSNDLHERMLYRLADALADRTDYRQQAFERAIQVRHLARDLWLALTGTAVEAMTIDDAVALAVTESQTKGPLVGPRPVP